MVLHAHRQVNPSISAYRTAVQLAPRSGRWRYLLARVLDVQGSEESLEQFAAAVLLLPSDPAVQLSFGNALLRFNRLAEAARSLQSAFDLSLQSSSQACIGLAQVAQAENRIEDAITWLEKGRSIAPQHGKIHALLAPLYQRAGKTEQASRALEEARRLPRDWPEHDSIFEDAMSRCRSLSILHQNAKTLLDRGDRASAVNEWNRILGLDPANLEANLQLANLFAEEKRWEEVRRHLERALQSRPDHLQALARLVHLERTLGRPEQALDGLRKMVWIEASADVTIELLSSLPAPMLRSLLLDAGLRGKWRVVADACCKIAERDPETKDLRELLVFSRMAAPDHSQSEATAALAEVRTASDTWGARRPLTWAARSLAASSCGKSEEAMECARTALQQARGVKGWADLVPILEHVLAQSTGPIDEEVPERSSSTKDDR